MIRSRGASGLCAGHTGLLGARWVGAGWAGRALWELGCVPGAVI